MKDQLQDLWTASVLKNAELPAVQPSHVESVTQSLKKRDRTWVMPSGILATAALSLLFLHPTPSVAAPTLSQVDQAVLAVKTFTITHQVVLGGAGMYNITEARDGDRWTTSYGPPKKTPLSEIVMDGHRTVSIRRFRGRIQVLIDGPSKFPQQLKELPTPDNFSSAPSELFRAGLAKVTVQKGVLWNGKLVDEFESLDSGRGRGTLRHTLYADATSHLPLLLKIDLPDSKDQFGETYAYDYTAIPESAFAPAFPDGAKITNIREERRAVRSAVRSDGLVIVDDTVTAGVFLPDTPSVLKAAKANKVRVRIDGGPASYTWPQPVSISAGGDPDRLSTWRQPVIYVQPPVANLGSLRKKKTVTVLVNGHRFTMPVMRIADTQIEFQFAGHRM